MENVHLLKTKVCLKPLHISSSRVKKLRESSKIQVSVLPSSNKFLDLPDF